MDTSVSGTGRLERVCVRTSARRTERQREDRRERERERVKESYGTLEEERKRRVTSWGSRRRLRGLLQDERPACGRLHTHLDTRALHTHTHEPRSLGHSRQKLRRHTHGRRANPLTHTLLMGHMRHTHTHRRHGGPRMASCRRTHTRRPTLASPAVMFTATCATAATVCV